MKAILLGRQGNQPFKIDDNADGVSRQHAQVTITDNDEWYLEDLGSSNGTYIRDENTGEMILVKGKRRITPMTFIFLGPDNSKGCCFFAKQADRYGDFTVERQYLVSKDEELTAKKKQIEKLNSNLTLIKTILPFIIFGLSLVLVPGAGTLQMLIRMGASAIPSALIQILYNPKVKENEIKDLREKFSHCPNPCCSNKQTVKEIRNMRCSKCKK